MFIVLKKIIFIYKVFICHIYEKYFISYINERYPNKRIHRERKFILAFKGKKQGLEKQ